MSPEQLWTWLFWAAAAIIAIGILFVQLPRMAREGLRIAKRIEAYKSHPLASAGDEFEKQAARITASLDELTGLIARANAAIATIRTVTLVPVAVGRAIARLRAGFTAFRNAARP